MRQLVLMASALALSGCATLSFAPPKIEQQKRLTRDTLDAQCAPTGGVGNDVGEGVLGARALIRNHLWTYECAMRVAANGRQVFELPAFASLVGSTVAVALGAGSDVALLGQAGNSVFTSGKNYYAPQEQATILRSAVDAVACIQSEASGISAYEVAVTSGLERNALGAVGGSIELTAEQQYFDLISSRLTAVYGAVTQRLAKRGTFDAAGVAAEIEKASEELKKAQEAKKNPPATGGPGVMSTSMAATLALSQKVKLDVDELRPKLDKCVARAKA